MADFAVGAEFPDALHSRGRHLYVIEFADRGLGTGEIPAFARGVDAALCRVNDDYRSHRADGFGLELPRVLVVPHGTFAAWMGRRGKLGGQHKVPRVINDPALFEDLRRFAASAPARNSC